MSDLGLTRPEADPWWGASTPAVEPAASSPAAVRARRSRSASQLPRSVRILTAPVRWIVLRAARSERGRRLARRGIVLLGILLVLACSGGVILINNVVIGRTAELGELSDRRRDLRRENALLGAEAARLAAGPVVIQRASRDLGMVRPTDLPTFTYLFDASRTLTPLQRRRVIARNARLRAAARAPERAATSAPAAGATAAKQVAP